MNNKPVRTCILAGVLLGSIYWFSYGGTSLEGDMRSKLLSQRVETFFLKNASMKDAVEKLRAMGLRICFEETSNSREDTTVKSISLNLQNRMLREILDHLVAQAHGYGWTKQDNTNLIVIHPKTNSVLSWNIPALRVKERSLMELLIQQDVLKFKEHGVILFYRGFSQPLEQRVSVDLENVSVIECLNALIASHPTLCWTLSVTPRGKKILTLHFAQREDKSR